MRDVIARLGLPSREVTPRETAQPLDLEAIEALITFDQKSLWFADDLDVVAGLGHHPCERRRGERRRLRQKLFSGVVCAPSEVVPDETHGRV